MKDVLWAGAIDRMMVRIDDTAAQVREGFPLYADPETGKWTASPDGDWTGGFWSGMLWLAHATTREQKYLDWAERWTDLLRPRARSENIFRSFLFYYNCGAMVLALASENIILPVSQPQVIAIRPQRTRARKNRTAGAPTPMLSNVALS